MYSCMVSEKNTIAIYLHTQNATDRKIMKAKGVWGWDMSHIPPPHLHMFPWSLPQKKCTTTHTWPTQATHNTPPAPPAHPKSLPTPPTTTMCVGLTILYCLEEKTFPHGNTRRLMKMSIQEDTFLIWMACLLSHCIQNTHASSYLGMHSLHLSLSLWLSLWAAARLTDLEIYITLFSQGKCEFHTHTRAESRLIWCVSNFLLILKIYTEGKQGL